MRDGRAAVVAALLVGLLPLGAFADRGGDRRRAAEIDPAWLSALEYRSIGPYRGGRVTAVAGVRGERGTFYMGSTGGGIWKTTDGGRTWNNVTDGQLGSGSIGAVAVAPSDANVVYAGTGSACVRGNVSPGDGVYRSTDAGETWEPIGLADAGQIGRIRVHPRDPDRVWVAALGHAFGPGGERGVFRSRDGGATWEQVLETGQRAGAVDLALDPHNPRHLYAAVWQVERQPWTMTSGGEQGGLYRSKNGGDTWEKLTEGLPEGVVGRIGVAVSGARRGRVWALVEAEEGGLFRSNDGGKTFRRINGDRNFRQRAWYYTHVYADPQNADTVWVLNVGLWRSRDGGEQFDFVRSPHGDHHDLWIDPDDPERLINGNDGGANVSYNGGASWSTQTNQPTGEFYRVSVDERFPYRIYGCQQDNTCVSIASRTAAAGIARQHWYVIGGCESGHVAIDPRAPDVTYSGCYGGQISRYDHRTGQDREIMAWPELAIGRAARDLRYRFQWNAPIRLSPHDPGVLFHCSQHVHRSKDEGQTWETISPDLSRNDTAKQDYAGGPITLDNTGVEVYGTVFAFEPSPHRPGLLWAGTDDGRVHLSRDDGGSWTEITPRKMPEWGQVNTIELSAHEPGRAFLAVTRYRMDDFRPYVFRTDDYGKSWKSLANGENGIPANHFVRVVREDPERRGLLFAGTEFGIYVSFDDGANWQSLQHQLPVTPITDLAVRHGDLVVATQGRGFWVLDDLSVLRQISSEVTGRPATLFVPRETYRFGGGFSFRGGEPAGQNPPAGAIVHYGFAEAPDEEVRLELLDAEGRVLRSFSSEHAERRAPSPWARFFPELAEPKKLPAEAGLNRFVWDLRLPDAELVDDAVLWGAARGPRVPPGTYRVRLRTNAWSAEQEFAVLADPRLTTPDDEFAAQYALARRIHDALSECHRALRDLRDVRDQLRELAERLERDGNGPQGSAETARRLAERLTEIEDGLTQARSESGQDVLNYPPRIDNQLLALGGVVESADSGPTAAATERFRELREALSRRTVELRDLLRKDLAGFNASLRDHGVLPLVPPAERTGEPAVDTD